MEKIRKGSCGTNLWKILRCHGDETDVRKGGKPELSASTAAELISLDQSHLQEDTEVFVTLVPQQFYLF